jgi:hypothetical protein
MTSPASQSQKNAKGLRAIAFPSQSQSAEFINIKQNGDRLSFALFYRLFQKLNDRLGLGKQLDLESFFCDHISSLCRVIATHQESGFQRGDFCGGRSLGRLLMRSPV